MEFTEVQEFNNFALHARSFMPGQFLPTDAPPLSSYQASTIQTVAPALMFDYEKALEDTPPASPSKYFTVQTPATLKLLEKNDEESIEDLLSTIKNSIIEYTGMNGIDDFSLQQTRSESPEPASPVKGQEDNALFGEKMDKDQREEANRNQLQFEKNTEDMVSKSYMETKNLKSFLSSSIKAFPMNKDYNAMKRAEIKTFKVYFLSEKHSTLLPISFAITIKDIIKQCLDTFKLNKAISEVMKYPDRPDAYELQRDMVSGPLDRQKTLKEIRIGRELVVVESKNFDASKPYVESQTSQNDSSPQNAIFAVTLHLPTEDRAKLKLKMGGERQLKDVFSNLALEGRTGFNMQQYNLRLYSNDPETRWKEAKNFLDTNIPLKNIKAYEPDHIQLELVKKKFADEPNEPLVDHRTTSSPVRKSGTVDMTHEDEQQIILYNEVSANHYEDFEVTKINENGRKQERVLGIDGFKLYNYTKSYKQEQAGRIGGIGGMFTNLFVSKFGTMNPERLLTDVNEAKILGGKVFQISVQSEGKTKWLCYEASDNKTANQIVAKINYLKGIDKKNI